MPAEILDPLPWSLSRDALLARAGVTGSRRRQAGIEELAEAALACARPRATYRMAYIENRDLDSVTLDGIRFTSRILRVNLDGLQRAFAFVCTSGRELEAWAEGQTDMISRFWADVINQAVLGAALDVLGDVLRDRYALGSFSTMTPGSLADWPLGQQRPLFALLDGGTEQIGVDLTPSLLMVPTKSVSGLLFPTEETFASCQICPRGTCPNRRAPYDAALLDRRYRTAPDPSRGEESG